MSGRDGRAPEIGHDGSRADCLNTISLAWWIGRAITLEKSIKDKVKRIIEAVGGSVSAEILAEGKITNVERVLRTRHTYGIIEVDGL